MSILACGQSSKLLGCGNKSRRRRIVKGLGLLHLEELRIVVAGRDSVNLFELCYDFRQYFRVKSV